MNKEMLVDMFRIPASSGNEEKMRIYIETILKKMNIYYEVDSIGNVYSITDACKPLLCAHMDTVQMHSDELLSKHIRIYKNIIKGYGVIGADDKAGIYTILNLLENGEKFNFLFTVSEEMGALGSLAFIKENDISFLPYALVIDRMGNDDIICYNNDYGVYEFDHTLEMVGEQFGFSSGHGTFSDADNLNEQLSCANLSCGYYFPHTKNEHLNLIDLQNTINFVHAIIKNITDKFDAPVKKFDNIFGINSYFDEDIKSFGFVQCNNCHGYVEETTYIETLAQHLCNDCISQLQWELEYISYGFDAAGKEM